MYAGGYATRLEVPFSQPLPSEAISNVVLYILLYIRPLYPSLYPSFTNFSIRFSPLYLISLQQCSLNLVLYTLNPILETYFVSNFCMYVFIIPQMLWTYFIFI
jgi:hypothetical protein